VRETEAVLHQRALDLLHPELVEPLDARALLGGLLEHDLIAASLPAALVGPFRAREELLDLRGRRPDLGEADRARERERVLRDLEDVVGDSRRGVLRPRLDVAERAALEQDREHRPAEASAEVVLM